MKRLGALMGAVAMVAAAFAVRGTFTDDGEDRPAGSPGRSDGSALLCPSEFDEICRTAAPDAATAVAGTTADALVDADDVAVLDADAWIVPQAWAELVIAERARLGREPLFEVVDGPLASSPAILAIWADRRDELSTICTTVDWACLAGRLGTVLSTNDRIAAGLPDVESASGLTIAAWQAAALLGRSDFAVNDFDGEFEGLAARLARGQVDRPLLAMRQQGPGLLTGAGVLAADATILSSTFGTIVPDADVPPAVRADVVALAPIGAELDADRRAALTDAFATAGWDPPTDGPAGLPDGSVLAAVRTLWNDSR